MSVKDLLLRNLPAKLLSLFFALVLWGVVIGEKKAQIQLNIPLELVKIPENAVVVSDVPASISLIVQGPRTILRGLPGRGIRKAIDLEGMVIGWTTIRILPDSISLPRGIEVVRVSPSTVDIKLEPPITVRLPVTPELAGDPPRGYRIEEVKVEPPEVLLKGGESELREIHAVKTHPVTLSKGPTDLEERVGLELEGLHLAEVSPPSVLVKVKLTPIMNQRIVKEIPVRATPPGKELSIEPDKVDVWVKGPLDVIEKLKATDIQVRVDLKGLNPGIHQVAPKITAPEGVRVQKARPAKVKVALEDSKEKQKD